MNKPLFTAVGSLEKSSIKNLNTGTDDCDSLIDGLDKCLEKIKEILQETEITEDEIEKIYNDKEYTRGFDLSLYDLMDQAKELYDTNVTLDKDSENMINELSNVVILKKQVLDKKESFKARIQAKREFNDKHQRFAGIVHCYDTNTN